MSTTYFSPSRFPVGGVPDVRALTTVASPSANLVRGAVVVADATGLIDLAGADPLLIAGIALQAASTAPGYSAANSPTTFTGRANKVSTAIANDATQFMGRLTNGSNVTVAPTAADIGVQYGITNQASPYDWTVDKAKVGDTARVIITAIDTNENRVWFKILAPFRQF